MRLHESVLERMDKTIVDDDVHPKVHSAIVLEHTKCLIVLFS
jgi:hypothetical protein